MNDYSMPPGFSGMYDGGDGPDKLRPCERCGGTDIDLSDDDLHCTECGFGVSSVYMTMEEAVELWNTRPIEDALAARLAEAESLWREFEWVQIMGHTICPVCHGPRHRGHYDDCRLQKIIAATAAATDGERGE